MTVLEQLLCKHPHCIHVGDILQYLLCCAPLILL